MALGNRILSPRTTLVPFISAEEAEMIAYPLNALPGARDVETVYGSMRVYEWGPADGEKILFVHGDTTPCLIFSNMAQALVDAGYRVMLFDLWGRGYSDTPMDCRLDVRLYASQILLAITSSPLAWIGNGNSFSIVGFSLGGAIAMAFAGAYPTSIRSVALLGPSGLLRKIPEGYEKHLTHESESAPPQQSLRETVRRIVEVAPSGPALVIHEDQIRTVSPPAAGPLAVERTFDFQEVLQWQFDYHQGYVHSIHNTILYGPVQNQEDLWARVCDIIAGRTRPDSALHGSKLLVFFGRDDEIVVPEETIEDILKLLPASHLQVEYLPGGHGFPYPNSSQIAQILLSFWGSKVPTARLA